MKSILKSWLIVALCLLCTNAAFAQSGWSDFSFEKIYLYGQINTPLEKGTEVFRKVFPNVENDLNTVARKVIEALYHSPQDPIPEAKIIYYTIYPDGALSQNGSVPPITKLSLNTDYVAEYYDRYEGDLDKVREELIGVLAHELVHTFQARPKNCGSYGVDPVYTSFIEGMADAVRYLTGDHTWIKPQKGGSYLNGYSTTGFFLLYLQDNYDPDFIRKFNQTANDLETWSYNAAIKRILGDQYDVNDLWKEYQNTFPDNKPSQVPTLVKEVEVSTPGSLATLMDDHDKMNVTDLTVKGTLNSADFYAMGKMPLITNLNLKDVTIIGQTNAECPNEWSVDNKDGYIPANAFVNHYRLKNVVLPASLKGIMMMAFKRAWQLSGMIDLPASVEEIQSVAFEDDSEIEGFICRSTTPPALNTTFMDYKPFHGLILDMLTLKVPKGSLAAYQTAEGWKDFGRIEEFDPATVANASVQELPETKVSVSGSTIHVEAPLTFVGVSIYDIEGRLISRQEFGHTNSVDLNVPSADGIRIVKVDFSQGVSESFKVR